MITVLVIILLIVLVLPFVLYIAEREVGT